MLKNKRTISFLVCMILILTSCIGKTGLVALSSEYTASSSYNSYSILIGKKYPTIYDCKNRQITNCTYSYSAVIKPDEKSMSELKYIFSQQEINEITEELSKGYPIVVPIEEKDYQKKFKYIKVFKTVNQFNDNQLCSHLISKVTNGLQANYDTYFKNPNKLKINFAIDAKGRFLTGDDGTVESDNYYSKAGIGLTIDKEIQNIAEGAIDTSIINKGAVVITDVETGAVLGICSRPKINLNKINDNENDFINRAITPYSVGSIFKIVVACSAIENGFEDFECECKGKIKVGDTIYSCQKSKIHGKEKLKNALANSCNCYFVKLALALGSEKLYKTAKDFGFGSETELSPSWFVSNGIIEDKNTLSSNGKLSLFAFGQGKLSATPIMFSSVVSTIANGGVYNSPYIIDGYIEADGSRRNADRSSYKGKQIISNRTAEIMQKYLRYVVTDGTGNAAESKDGLSAGKTSTAQSGQYKNGKEILHTWFAGFYPCDKPKYAIIIFNEDGKSGGGDCGPIFRQIVDKLNSKK